MLATFLFEHKARSALPHLFGLASSCRRLERGMRWQLAIEINHLWVRWRRRRVKLQRLFNEQIVGRAHLLARQLEWHGAAVALGRFNDDERLRIHCPTTGTTAKRTTLPHRALHFATASTASS